MAQNDPAPAPTDSRHSASSEDHESAASLNARAYRLQRRGHHAEAEPLLRRALEKDPNHPYAQYNLGWSLVEQGKAKEAVAPLEKTASRQPNRWEPQQRLAEAYEKLGEQDKAQEAYARARSLRGGRSGRYRRRGYSRHRDGEDQGDQGESRSTHRRRRSRRHSQPAAEKDGQDSPDAPTYVDEDSVLRKAPARGAPDEGGKGDDE
jgi:predicted Zn-dependent protease